MTDGQTVNRLQILRNELFGEIEILQTATQTFIAKRLTPRSAAIFERANKVFPFLFSNEFPFFQEFHAQTEIFGATYLLFRYYDYSLQTMLEGNLRSSVQMPESMLVKLLNDLFFALTFLKNKGMVYPLLHNKTVFVSKTGNLKLTNPLLFEEGFVNLDRTTDEGLTLLEADRRFADVGRIALEQATFTNLFGPEVTPADYQAALTTLRSRYSFDFYNFMRKFDFLATGRVPSESRYQNYNAAENFYNINCPNIDKYLAGVRVNNFDFEFPKTAKPQIFTVKNGSVFKMPDRKPGIFDSQNHSPQIFPSSANPSGQFVKMEAPVNRGVAAIRDLPPGTDSQMMMNSNNNIGIIEMSASRGQDSQRNSGRIFMQNQPTLESNRFTNSPLMVNPNFSKKKTEDSFFDEVLERPSLATVRQEARVSNASQNRPPTPTQMSLKADSFFDIPANFQETYQAHLVPQYRQEHDVSASFRNNMQSNPFLPSHRESSQSEFRRSRSSNPTPVDVHDNSFQNNNMLQYAHTSPVYIDPNESFSKRLAQVYQREYRERNDSMRESMTSGHGHLSMGAVPNYYASPTQVKPADKQYAVIHDFPVRS